MNPSLQKPLYRQSLLVDLYELTMAAGYFENNYNPISTFEVFVREMPPNRSFLVAAGLQQVLEYIADLQFTDEEVDYLRSLPVFKHVSKAFLITCEISVLRGMCGPCRRGKFFSRVNPFSG